MDDTDSRPSSAISFPHAVTSLLVADKLLHYEQGVVLSLQSQTEKEILETRGKAKLAGKLAWRLEAACDAEVISRANNVRGHNFRSGASAHGVMFAAKRQAKKVGCTPAVVFQNARIYRLIQEVEGANSENSTELQLLDEKGFFIAALSAANPHKAVLIFAQRKATLKRFRVTDAQRLLEREGLTKKVSVAKAVSSIRSAPRNERFAYLKKLQAILSECPDVDLLSRLGLQDCLDDVTDELGNMLDEDIAAAIKKHWALTHRTLKALSNITGFPEADIERIICEMPEFIEIPGSEPTMWQKVGVRE
jgi:hypothetical protein